MENTDCESLTGLELEDDAEADELYIITSLPGLVKKSARTLVLPFICLQSKGYFENHSDHLRSWGCGTSFYLNLSICGKEDISISTRK